MKKHERHKLSGEKKIAENKKFDFFENQKMTEQQKKNWQRKPYSYGGPR